MNIEHNKLFAALLVAGIAASFTGFISHKLVSPKDVGENAYQIEGVEVVAQPGASQGPAGPDPILALLASADIAKGQQTARVCATCHSFVEGGPNGLGPDLWDVVNNDKATHDSYSYSPAMLASEGVWSYASLNTFLWRPRAYVEGTKMNFVGLRKAEDRANVIAYLRSLSHSPAPLPSAAEIAAEQAEHAPEPVAEDKAE